MTNASQQQGLGSNPAPTATMERLPGSADARGSDYEFKMAALLALRLRRRGARFQLFSNARAAQPFDDLVLRVLDPQPATLLAQLKHKDPAKWLTLRAFATPGGPFGLHKYFEFYKEIHIWHKRQVPLTADQQLMCETPLDDVWFLIYTPADLRGADTRPTPAVKIPFQDELQTDPQGQCIAFDARDQQVWDCMSKAPPEDQQLFRGSFLPQLRVFCRQAAVEQLDELLEAEVNLAFGQPLPRSDVLTEQLLRRFKAWAQSNPSGEAVSDAAGLLGAVVGEALRRAGRAAAGGGALRFHDARCSRLRKLLQRQRARGGGCLHVRARGLPQGHRAAKLLQLLEEEPWAERWVYVGDRALREFPRVALETTLGANDVVVVDAERELEKARALVAAAGGGRVQVVVAGAGEDAEEDWGLAPQWEAPEEDWALEQLTAHAQEALLNSTIVFQGEAMPLRALEDTWPGLRAEVDGPLLSALAVALAEGAGPELGAAPPAPDDDLYHIQRSVHHVTLLDRAVLTALDPAEHRFALSGFSAEELRKLSSSSTDKVPDYSSFGVSSLKKDSSCTTRPLRENFLHRMEHVLMP